jgi:transcriptional regulator
MDEPLFDDLRQIRRQRDRANTDFDEQETQVITLIRGKGYTWDQIAQVLGVTRQSAWERYASKIGE